jgi:hypothetical protein
MLVDQKPSYKNLTKQDYEAMAGPDWPDFDLFCSQVQIEKFIADELDVMLGQVNDLRTQSASFCVLPFYGREYPTNAHCCLLPVNVDIERVRADMLNNVRTSACQACWTLEDAGVFSDRQLKNQTLDFYTKTDITQIFQQALKGQYSVNHYKIAASNYCNSTCVTCGPCSSTLWQTLENKQYQKIIPMLLRSDSKLVQIDYDTAKFVHFTGGESTMIRTHWDIIEKLVASGNTDCGICFVTNGSFSLTVKQRQLLSKLKYVIFCFSIDGIGSVFEYLRYPLSWKTTVDNVRWAQDQGFETSVSYTVSNLNVLYHDQTLEWFKQNKLNYLENVVYSPQCFSPRSLSQRIKNQISDQTSSSLIRAMLSQHTDHDQANFIQFRTEIQRQDQLKQINIGDYLPEFTALMSWQ